MRDTGLFHKAREHGNLPAGECYVAPIEDRTSGVFVVDKSYPGILIEEPIRLTVRRRARRHDRRRARSAAVGRDDAR